MIWKKHLKTPWWKRMEKRKIGQLQEIFRKQSKSTLYVIEDKFEHFKHQKAGYLKSKTTMHQPMRNSKITYTSTYQNPISYKYTNSYRSSYSAYRSMPVSISSKQIQPEQDTIGIPEYSRLPLWTKISKENCSLCISNHNFKWYHVLNLKIKSK